MTVLGLRARFTALAASFAALIAWPTQANAWGNEGHSIVANTALKILFARNPEMERRFYAILRRDILDFSYSYVNRGRTVNKTCSADRLDDAAVWPDCVRRSSRYSSTADFHYDDVRRCTDTPPLPNRDEYCRDGLCATAALRRFVAQIRDPSSTDRERAEALVWIIHIVGDLHQPLHATTNRDSGGNGVTISYVRQTRNGPRTGETKLHTFWDGDMVRSATRPADWDNRPVPMSARIDLIRQLAMANQPAWGLARLDLETLEPTAFDDWVIQSHTLSQHAYNRLATPPECDAGRSNGGLVPADYMSGFRENVQERLAAASLRLADLLEQVL